MNARQSMPGLNRNESDAAAAIGAFFLGMLVLLCTTVLGLHLLSGLPPIMVYGILFAVAVFGAVCIAAFLRSEVSPRHAGPPQLQFRNPPRRRRRTPRPTPQA
jgi:hypothetical protein